MIGEAAVTVVAGTKAQLIKMAPVVAELTRRGIAFRLVDTGQHGDLAAGVAAVHGLPPADARLVPGTRGVDSLAGGLLWTIRVAALNLLPRATLRRRFFGDREGIALVHGDTMSTLLATLLARRAGQRVAHVEAGLRSGSLVNPFPEEIIRILVMRLSAILFAPSPEAMANLRRMGLSGRAVETGGNTCCDTLAELRRDPGPLPAGVETPFAVATLHRLETLVSRRRLASALRLIVEASRIVPVVLVVHPPTARALARGGAARILEGGRVRTIPLCGHGGFVAMLREAEMVLTDGGSVQEEAAVLGVPCLLLRRRTERPDGLGENVVLSGLDAGRARGFFADFRSLRRPERLPQASPSAKIVDALEAQA